MILKAYRIMADHTPICADCGELCGKACCHGDKEHGMMLFPEEASRIWHDPHFRIEKRDMCGESVWFAVCDGHCDRKTRPLSCRIYPFVLRDGAVVFDDRARRICPLGDHGVDEYYDPRFLEAVRKTLASYQKHYPRFFAAWQRALAEYDKFFR